MNFQNCTRFFIGDKALYSIDKDTLTEVEITRIYEEEPLYQIVWWNEEKLTLERRDVFTEELIPLEVGDIDG